MAKRKKQKRTIVNAVVSQPDRVISGLVKLSKVDTINAGNAFGDDSKLSGIKRINSLIIDNDSEKPASAVVRYANGKSVEYVQRDVNRPLTISKLHKRFGKEDSGAALDIITGIDVVSTNTILTYSIVLPAGSNK